MLACARPGLAPPELQPIYWPAMSVAAPRRGANCLDGSARNALWVLGRQVVPAQKQADHKGNLPDVPEFHFPIRQDPLAGFPATESEESSSSSSPDWSGPSSTAGESAEGLYFGLRLFGASGVSMT